jgi:hypothetical protein
MTAERARAYGDLIRMLDGLGPARLWPSERSRVRAAADSLVLCDDLHEDEAARTAVVDVGALGRDLTESDRWSKRRAGELVTAVLACGPREIVLPQAA